MKNEEVETVFKALLNADGLNFRKNYGLRLKPKDDQQQDDNDTSVMATAGEIAEQKTFKYRQFVKLLS